MSKVTQTQVQARRWSHLAISASAGTGKTFRLSNRFLDLLANGIANEEILATTFTRKAAGEILDRVLLRLAQAATSDKKRQELGSFLQVSSFSQADCLQLLTDCTRNLNRLRISTLDSFFMAIASSHSLELGLPSGWTIVDEVTDAALRAEAMRDALAQDATSSLVNLLHLLTKGETTRSVFREVQEVVGNLYGLYLETTPEAWRMLARSKGLEPRQLEESILALESLPLPTGQFDKKRREEVDKARAGDWTDFIRTGLASKILHGETTFSRKEIPAELVALYQPLLDHAKSELLNPIVFQNEATFTLLEKFDREYQRLKFEQQSLRFEDVTRLVAQSPALQQVEQLGFRLDGSVRHLLLDEFQDTSLSQWQVLRPFAKQVTSLTERASFFCVGDVKQAIYGWRGGLAQIFEALEGELGQLTHEKLVKSFRSSPAVIETVNHVFAKLHQHNNLDDHAATIVRWQERFSAHETALTELPGYACLRTLPEVPEDLVADDVRDEYVAHYVEQLRQESPHAEIGILVKKNDTVRRMIFALRERGIYASEEGGNPLIDSAAVSLVLSLLRLSDHPGDTAAWFHVAHSPLGVALEIREPYQTHTADRIASGLRSQLLAEGYGACLLRWAKSLAPACNQREMSRLDQLVELAYSYQAQATLRADGFVAFVEQQKVSDPTQAPVRVMNVHQSKGLEFDIVVLPELDKRLIGQPPQFVVGRDSPVSPVTAVCRYVNQDLQSFLPKSFQNMFEQADAERLSEALCVLYVALTRAKHALHMLVEAKPAASANCAKTSAGLLRAALCDNRQLPPDKLVYEVGDPRWFEKVVTDKTAEKSAPAVEASPSFAIKLAATGKQRQRGWQAVSPSQLEGGGARDAQEIFRAERSRGQQFGTLAHAWLAEVRWLSEGVPGDETLRRIAVREEGTQIDLLSAIAQYRRWLTLPGLIELLDEERFRKLSSPLAKDAQSLQIDVFNERTFALQHDEQLLTGSIDRLILWRRGKEVVAAEVIDYKTDTLAAGDRQALAEKVDFYRPQLQAYRQAVAQLYRLTEKQIRLRLFFLATGESSEV